MTAILPLLRPIETFAALKRSAPAIYWTEVAPAAWVGDLEDFFFLQPSLLFLGTFTDVAASQYRRVSLYS